MNENVNTKDVLHEQVVDALNGIDVMDIASDESSNAVDNAIKLVDREIELQKIEVEQELKEIQIEQDNRNRRIDRVIDCGKFLLALAAGTGAAFFAYYFEEKGELITTQQGKRDTKKSLTDWLNWFTH